jgi:hypothetical protein
MIGVAELARRFSLAARPRGRVAPEYVLAHLRPRGPLEAADPRVLEIAGQASRLIVEERMPKKHRGFTRYFETMPRILYLYGRGYSADEIAAQMPFLCSGYGVDVVLRLVADAIAKRIGAKALASNGGSFPRT